MQVDSAESEEESEEEEGEGETGGAAASSEVKPKKLTGPVKRKRADASLGEKSGK